MTSLVGLRRRLPLIVFVLLLVFCLFALALACLCMSGDHSTQALDRVAAFANALPALVALWSFITIVIVASTVVAGRRSYQFGRASPASLQRFLF